MKIDLDDLIFGVSAMTKRIYAGVPDEKSSLWKHKRDVTDDVVDAVSELAHHNNGVCRFIRDGRTFTLTLAEEASK